MIWLTAWLTPAIVIMFLGLCIAHLKQAKTGVFPLAYFRDTFIVMWIWPLPLLIIVVVVVVVPRHKLKQMFNNINL